MRSANAQIGLATANFFLRIGLTALFGRASSPLSSLSSGQSTVWSVAGNVARPIFQGGALKAAQRQNVAFREQTRLQYEQTAQLAFQDVSNALISRLKYEAIRDEQARAVQACEESVKVSLQRYTAGKASYFEVLDAQLELYAAQNALALTELNRRTVIVLLYKALGGGWNLSDAAWSNPSCGQQSRRSANSVLSLVVEILVCLPWPRAKSAVSILAPPNKHSKRPLETLGLKRKKAKKLFDRCKFCQFFRQPKVHMVAFK